MPGNSHQIVTGISLSNSGQATVAPLLSNVLFDIALQLEELTHLPVDVQHVVAAIVLAAHKNELASDAVLVANDPELIRKLVVHIKTIFARFGNDLESD